MPKRPKSSRGGMKIIRFWSFPARFLASPINVYRPVHAGAILAGPDSLAILARSPGDWSVCARTSPAHASPGCALQCGPCRGGSLRGVHLYGKCHATPAPGATPAPSSHLAGEVHTRAHWSTSIWKVTRPHASHVAPGAHLACLARMSARTSPGCARMRRRMPRTSSSARQSYKRL